MLAQRFLIMWYDTSGNYGNYDDLILCSAYCDSYTLMYKATEDLINYDVLNIKF